MHSHVRASADISQFRAEYTVESAILNLKATCVRDGAWDWYEMEMKDEPAEVRKKPIEDFPQSPEQLPLQFFNRKLREALNFTAVSEVQVNGAAFYVMHANAKSPARDEGGPAELLFHISKEDLTLKQIDYQAKEQEESMKIVIVEHKSGVKFDAEVFKYTPPEGAKVHEERAEPKAPEQDKH
jgi:hypothetical protein